MKIDWFRFSIPKKQAPQWKYVLRRIDLNRIKSNQNDFEAVAPEASTISYMPYKMTTEMCVRCALVTFNLAKYHFFFAAGDEPEGHLERSKSKRYLPSKSPSSIVLERERGEKGNNGTNEQCHMVVTSVSSPFSASSSSSHIHAVTLPAWSILAPVPETRALFRGGWSPQVRGKIVCR